MTPRHEWLPGHWCLRQKWLPPGGNDSCTTVLNLRWKCRNNFKIEDGMLHYRKNGGSEKEEDNWRICVRSEEKNVVFLNHAILELQVWEVARCIFTVATSWLSTSCKVFLLSFICTDVGSHLGRNKTVEKITSCFFWRNMNEEIRQFVQNCDKCQRMNAKFVKRNAKLHPIPVSSELLFWLLHVYI